MSSFLSDFLSTSYLIATHHEIQSRNGWKQSWNFYGMRL